MKPINNRDYFANKNYWHQSSLKYLLSSPVKALHSKLDETTNEQLASLAKGSAVHYKILGEGEPIIVPSMLADEEGKPFTDWKKKRARELRDEYIEKGYTALGETEWYEVHYAVDAIKAHPIYPTIEAAQYKECAIFATFNGVKIACKPDAVHIDEKTGKVTIIDLKTSRDLLGDIEWGLQGFEKAIWNYSYYFQQVIYKLAVQHDLSKQGINVEYNNIDYILVAVENRLRDGLDKPLCAIYRISAEYEDYGYEQVVKALELAKEYSTNLDTQVQKLQELEQDAHDNQVLKALDFDNSDKVVEIPKWTKEIA